jgi:thiamine-phosphate pyrophosphorylase
LIFYYITDRRQFPGTAEEQRTRLLAKIAEAGRAGVDLIQLREKDLPARELERLAREAARAIRENAGPNRTRLLINSRADVAIAAGADGVHLRADDVTASEARAIFSKASVPAPIIGVSCHSPAEVRRAEAQGASFVVFGAVFEKSGAPGQSLAALREACGKAPAPGVEAAAVPAATMPVLALGGVTVENAGACLATGAAGIAAIRLFQENEVARVIEKIKIHHRDTEKFN